MPIPAKLTNAQRHYLSSMSMCAYLLLIVLAVAPAIGQCGSAKEDFADDALLATASKDILAMPAPELDAFITYLASCGGTRWETTRDFFCGRDRQLYLMKFGRSRPIDRMINVIAIAEQRIETEGKVAEPVTKERAAVGRAIARLAEIKGKFYEAANLRSMDLLKEAR